MSILYGDLVNTNFPNSYDSFTTMLNMIASDGTFVAQYQTAMDNGDLATAQSILSQIPNANQKVLTADKLNKFKDSIIALERFYLTDIAPYVTTKQTEWTNTINLFKYIGVYNPSTTYAKNNFVEYTVGGIKLLYICVLVPPTGTDPLNNTYWRVLTIQGQKGDSGVGMAFLFAWNSATAYSLQNVVSYANALWGCSTAHTNQTPFSGSTYWNYIASIEGAVYPIQASEPAGLNTGSLWFRTL